MFNKVDKFVSDVKRGFEVDLSSYPALEKEVLKKVETNATAGAMVGNALATTGSVIGVVVCGTTWLKGTIVIAAFGIGGTLVGAATGFGASTIKEAAKLGKQSDLKRRVMDVKAAVVG